ncbi:retention module-containing protein [Marinomonas sp. GJ51-6]|uniref:retention module-containing protein n=1 Tax=Marinomonas sp. GJ51-6 TaxID=2992802 RepID=UPI0029344EDF|nr:retention module-containing protein [Marinomonas sp. GJ51-6]WOD07025.1 retention module-containing protein [Marinomonas sp. GJ51-6]
MNHNQQQFATLGEPIGSITQLGGSAIVQSIGGQDRSIKIGDSVFYSETVVTQSDDSVLITFVDETEMAIGPYSTIELSDDAHDFYHVDDFIQSSTVSTSELQQAILDGVDPTLIQESPEAGETIIDDQHRVNVNIDRNNEGALPGYGFDTNSVSTLAFTTEEETHDTNTIDAVAASVTADLLVSEDSTSAGTEAEEDDSVAVIDRSLSPEEPVADTSADAGVVIVDDITSDDMINLAESNQIITVTGTATGGDISEDDLVTLVINNQTYTTRVASDATWSVEVEGADLAEDAKFTAVVSSSDTTGNTVESVGSSVHSVDTKAFGQIDTYKVTDDSTISSSESAAGELVEITGYVGNDARPGDLITVNLDDLEIGRGIVSDVQDSNGKYLYTVSVLGSDLANTTQTNPNITVIVSGEDDAGNPFSTQTTEVYFIEETTYADAYVFLADTNYDGVITEGEAENLLVAGWIETAHTVSSIVITDSEGETLTVSTGVTSDDDGSWVYFENSIDVSGLSNGALSVVVNVADSSGIVAPSEAEVIAKDTDEDTGVIYLSDTVSIDARIAEIDDTQTGSVADSSIEGTASDDDLRGVSGNSQDTINGNGGDDVLIGGNGADTLIGAEGNDILVGGTLGADDDSIDTLTGGAGEDTFVLYQSHSLDVITDFNAKDDRLDLTALLSGLSDNPGSDADTDAIAEFLSANVKVQDQSVEVNGAAVASFGADSNFDSDNSGAVTSVDAIKVIFNDQEYSVNIDG